MRTTAQRKKPNASCSSSTTALLIASRLVIAASRAPSWFASASWRVRLRNRASAPSSARGCHSCASCASDDRQPPVAAFGAVGQEGGRQIGERDDLAAATGALAIDQRTVRARDEVARAEAGGPLDHAGGCSRHPGVGEVAQGDADSFDRSGGDLAGLLLVRVDRDQRELVAAVARLEVVRARRALQRVTDPAQHLVADEMSVLVVDLLEAVEVDQHERERRARRALRPFDLAREAIVEGTVVEAAGQRIRARGAGQARLHVGVLERDGGELGERLERVELRAAGADAAPVGDREHAAQLPAPVDGHGQRCLDPGPGRAGRRTPDQRVVVGHHRAVLEQHLAREPRACGHAEAELLRREPVRRLDRELLGVGDPVDHGRVRTDQRRGFMADAAEQRREVERLVQRLGGARERRVVAGGAPVLVATGLVGEGRGGGAGERQRELQRRRIDLAGLVIARRECEHALWSTGDAQEQHGRRREGHAQRAGECHGGLPAHARVVFSRRGKADDGAERSDRHRADRAFRARHARIAVAVGQRDQGRHAESQQDARLSGERPGERILARVRCQGEHPCDEREAVGGGAELAWCGHGREEGGIGSGGTVRSMGSASPAQPLHWRRSPGHPRALGEVAEWLKALAC